MSRVAELARVRPHVAGAYEAALKQCLREHVAYHDCEHPTLDACCCTCEGKRLLGIPAGVTPTLRRAS